MEQNSLRSSVLSGFFWKFCERFLNQGITFITSLVLARLLAPEDYGVVGIVMVFINLAAVFINNGFSSALVQKKDANDVDFSTMFLCSMACAAVLYLLLFLGAPLVAWIYKNPALKLILRVYALNIPLSVCQSIQLAYISRHMLFRKTFINSAINAVICGIVGIGLALAGFGVWALVLQGIVGTIANTIVLFFLIPWRPKFVFSKSSAKGMLGFSSRVLAAELSATFFAEVRSLVVGAVYSTADLAYYNKGQQIPHLITNNLSGILGSVMFPAVANFSDDLQQVKNIMRRGLRVLAYVLVPCMFGLAAVMEPLVILLFTEKWALTIPLGQILSIDTCFAIFESYYVQIMKAIGRSDVVLKLEMMKKPVYLVLLLIGVSINVPALAVAMILFDVFALILDMFYIKKYIPYEIREQLGDMLPALGVGVIMAAVVFLLPSFSSLILTLVVKIAAGAAVYLAGSVIFRLEAFRYLKNILLERFKK